MQVAQKYNFCAYKSCRKWKTILELSHPPGTPNIAKAKTLQIICLSAPELQKQWDWMIEKIGNWKYKVTWYSLNWNVGDERGVKLQWEEEGSEDLGPRADGIAALSQLQLERCTNNRLASGQKDCQ